MSGSADRSEAFWRAMCARLVHPLKVKIIDVMLAQRQPMSASDLIEVLLDDEDSKSIAYHVRSLAQAGALKLVRVDQGRRGSPQKFYRLSKGRFRPKS